MCPTSGTLQERLEGDWQSAVGMTRDVENMTHIGRLEGLGLFREEKIRVKIVTVLKYIKSFCREKKIFCYFSMERTRKIRLKLQKDSD